MLPSIDFLEESVRAYSAREIPLDGMRESAVLILICESESGLYVALQVRTNTVAHHKGEISFPGGRRDPEDSDLSVTALRETNEEMGVESDEIALIGRLDDTCTIVSNYRISPYIGLLRGVNLDGLFSKADAEVRDVLIVKLDTLMSPESRVWHMVEQSGSPTATRAYSFVMDGVEHLVWGATARILTNFFHILDLATNDDIDEEGVQQMNDFFELFEEN